MDYITQNAARLLYQYMYNLGFQPSAIAFYERARDGYYNYLEINERLDAFRAWAVRNGQA